jgi:hypothetical protein
MADYIPAYLVAQPKPERATRKAAKRKAARTFTLTRAQVRQLVFAREKGHCQRCRVPVSFDVAAWKDERAQSQREPSAVAGWRSA